MLFQLLFRFISKRIKEFFESVRHFLIEKIPWMIDDLKLRINDKFQIIKINPINLS